MNKQLLVVACALLAVQVRSDLQDEAHLQLEELRSVVTGNILVAHDELDDVQIDFLSYAINTEQSGFISVEEQEQAIQDELQTIKDLSWAAGKDPSPCTNIREQVLNRLADEYKDATSTCIDGDNNEARRVVRDARYIVDVSIGKVNDLDFQLTRCGGQILCISPLVTEIELDKVRLPQNIKTEVTAASSLLTILKLSVQICSEDKVAEYASESTSILRDIAACINRLLDS